VLEFWILGPLEVRRDGRPIKLGAAKQRALLAILLLNANRVVSRDRLGDGLWGEQPPATASTALRVYVSELRKALAAEDDVQAISSAEPGYRIDIRPDQLDLTRFERLTEEAGRALAQGDSASASEKLHAALELWRGPALDDFTYEPFAQSAIVRLEELRVVALERRVEADLALGRQVELVPELEGLVTEHPLRERLRGQLMLALYRCGRQADALAAYQAARRTLADELGIEPSQPLQQLEQAILRQDPPLELGVGGRDAEAAAIEPPAPADTPPDRSLLVVSDSEDALDSLLAIAESLAARPRRELIIALLASSDELAEMTDRLARRRDALRARGMAVRTVAFSSQKPGRDTVRLASEQDADLVLLNAGPALLEAGEIDGEVGAVLAEAPCDVALVADRGGTAPDEGKPVMVPVGGAEHEWAAVELGSWVAKARGAPLVLLGTSADAEAETDDASRLLAHVSLAAQRGLGIDCTPLLVPRGDEGVLDASREASLLVIGLSDRWRQEGLGATRLAVAQTAPVPVLIVRRGLRPGGLAPRESLTRFTWSLTAE
jgi:DNA-binding SARP family transcriptional activator